MARFHLTTSPFLVISLLLKVLLDGFMALGAFVACFASNYLLGAKCFDNLEAGGRLGFNIAFYGAMLLIASFALLMFIMTFFTFFFERSLFRAGIPKSIRLSLIVFGLIIVLFYLFAVFPAGQYCSASPLGW